MVDFGELQLPVAPLQPLSDNENDFTYEVTQYVYVQYFNICEYACIFKFSPTSSGDK